MASSGQVGIGVFVAALMVPGLVGCTEVVTETITATVTQTVTVTVTTTPRPQTPTSLGGATPSEEHTQSPIPTPGPTPTCAPYITPDPNFTPTPAAPNEGELKLWLNGELIYSTGEQHCGQFYPTNYPDVPVQPRMVFYDPDGRYTTSIIELRFGSYESYLCTPPKVLTCGIGGGGDYVENSIVLWAYGYNLPEGTLPESWEEGDAWENCAAVQAGVEDEVDMVLDIKDVWPRFRASANVEIMGAGVRSGDILIFEAEFDCPAPPPPLPLDL